MIFRKLAILVTLAALLVPVHALAAKSGYAFIMQETRDLQDDDFENPGMLTVERGNELFNAPIGNAEKSCADCHGTDAARLDPKNLAQFPKYDRRSHRIVTMQDRIISCSKATGGSVMEPNDSDRVALETYVRHLARGEPVNVDTRGLEVVLAEGEKLFNTRYGLIDMSCQHCHGFYAGRMVRGQRISQGMGNGFPAYRLGIGEITTLQQRITQCLNLMRAEPFEPGSDEMRTMEFYMMSRSNGLPIETPAVRY